MCQGGHEENVFDIMSIAMLPVCVYGNFMGKNVENGRLTSTILSWKRQYIKIRENWKSDWIWLRS